MTRRRLRTPGWWPTMLVVASLGCFVAGAVLAASTGALHGLSVTLHLVRPGETLASLLKQFQTTRGSLEGLNATVNLDALKPGDRVRVELSPYDLTRGRITYRLK